MCGALVWILYEIDCLVRDCSNAIVLVYISYGPFLYTCPLYVDTEKFKAGSEISPRQINFIRITQKRHKLLALTYKQLEPHGCIFSIVADDALIHCIWLICRNATFIVNNTKKSSYILKKVSNWLNVKLNVYVNIYTYLQHIFNADKFLFIFVWKPCTGIIFTGSISEFIKRPRIRYIVCLRYNGANI